MGDDKKENKKKRLYFSPTQISIGIAVILAALVSILSGGYYYLDYYKRVKKPAHIQKRQGNIKKTFKKKNKEGAAKLPDLSKIERSKGFIAIIIDDLGWDKKIGEGFLEINLPLTYSVIPFTPYSKYIAEEANSKGKEILLHIPMEPYGYSHKNLGKGTLLVSMDIDTIKNNLIKSIDSIPYAVGSNNHMGSRFTEQEWAMRAVMDVLKERGLFFIDSLTTSKTKGYSTAKEKGIKTEKRNIFLDNNKGLASIKNQINKLISISKKRGKAIGIGHPYKNTLKALEESLDIMNKGDIKMVPVSDLAG